MYFILFKYRTRSNELCMTCKYYLVGNINVIQCRDYKMNMNDLGVACQTSNS